MTVPLYKILNTQELQGSKIDESIFCVPFEFDLNLDEQF